MDIELRHIHKRFGTIHANNDINLTFKGGRIIGVLGENGAGKSTLMKILSGFQPADSGEILVGGRSAHYTGPQSAIQFGVGMLQQDPLDVPAFTVLENFIYGYGSGLGMNRKKARTQLNIINRRFGFDLDPETPVSQLTIAQRQQLEIGRLLTLGVRTLILDEPTTGISSEQKELLFEALHEISQHDGMTVLIVSHKLEDVVALCNEVVVLRAGKVVGERQMPATTKQLVAMMFGEELATQTREQQAIKQKRTSDREVVVLERVSLREKRLHIDNLSLRVYAGQVIGLAGLDGSGQELVMRACVGLAKTHGGRVLVEGRDMTSRPYRSFMGCGLAFAASGRLEEGLVAGLTLTEHVALATESGALIDWERARLHTEQQIQQYNVRGRPSSPIETLSGGNQQRMLMALLPPQPKLLALEQPTRGLDVDSAQWIWQQLLARRDSGTSIMFSSPDLDELVMYSDRILVFYAGRVMEISDAATTNIDELGRLIGGDYTEHR